MKAEFICEKCGKKYETPEEALECEAVDTAAEAEKVAREEEQKAEANHIRELYNNYVKKYGETPFRIPSVEMRELFNTFFPLF